MNFTVNPLIILIVSLCGIGIVFLLPLSHFRKPTGLYGVGTVSYHWIDAHRQEFNDKKEDASREVMVYFYYPTQQKIDTAIKQYDADALESEKIFIAAKSKSPIALLQGWNFIKTYAQDRVDLSESCHQYPVIIIPHGGGTMIQHYTWMLEEFASHGYIVVGINHPYMAAITRFPDGRVIPSIVHQTKDKQKLGQWKQEQLETCVADIEFVIKQLHQLNQTKDTFFYNKLDLTNLGLAGHSFGGHLALIVAAQNSAVKAVVNMDGGQRSFPYILNKPFSTPCLMLFAQESRQWKGLQGESDRKTLDAFCHEHAGNVSQFTIPHAGHGLFSDLPILMHTILYSRWLTYWFNFDFDTTSMTACKEIELVSQQLLTFFDKNLKHKNESVVQPVLV